MDYTRIFNIIKDLYKGASDEDIKTVLSFMGYEEPSEEEVQAKKELEELRALQKKGDEAIRKGISSNARKAQLARERKCEEPETIEIKPITEGDVCMPTVTPTTKTTFAPAPIPATIPAPSPEETAAYRERLFLVYPEIGEIYKDCVGETNTILATRWFSNPAIGSNLAKFTHFIEYLQVEEIFPNFKQIKRAAELTDGGTVDTPTRSVQKLICEKSFEIARTSDESKKISLMREVVVYILKINEGKKEIPEMIKETFTFCGYDADLMLELYNAEKELQSLLANK